MCDKIGKRKILKEMNLVTLEAINLFLTNVHKTLGNHKPSRKLLDDFRESYREFNFKICVIVINECKIYNVRKAYTKENNPIYKPHKSS